MKKLVGTFRCGFCGNEFDTRSKNAYLCNDCESKLAIVKKMEKVDKAVQRLNKKRYAIGFYWEQEDMTRFGELLKAKIRNNEEQFSSLPEMMVAMQLMRQEIEYETQKTIGGCCVDFVLPKEKRILEIDGSLYHTDQDNSFLRDRRIMASLDESWEIIHLDAEAVPDYTWDLKEAIQYIIDERNDRHKFRDSTWDTNLLEEYCSFAMSMRKGNGKNLYAV